VAWLYRDLLDLFVYDETDNAAYRGPIEDLGVRAIQAQTIMTDDESRAALARLVIDAALAGPAVGA
jgi:hypothetical protein